MKTTAQVMKELEKKGSAQTVRTFARHGAPSAMFGVKVSDLKVIAKQIKGNQALALDLYDTANSDAMYLAGLVADGAQMTKRQLEAWARKAPWYMISEYTVPWVAVESQHGRALALKWMDSKKEAIASSGWATYSGLLATKADEDLDFKEIKQLLARVVESIDDAPNRVRYTMNGFVMSVGCYVVPLSKQAKSTAKKIGKVSVDMGKTACKVPLALEYIEKAERNGRTGKKRKTFKC